MGTLNATPMFSGASRQPQLPVLNERYVELGRSIKALYDLLIIGGEGNAKTIKEQICTPWVYDLMQNFLINVNRLKTNTPEMWCEFLRQQYSMNVSESQFKPVLAQLGQFQIDVTKSSQLFLTVTVDILRLLKPWFPS